VQGTALAGKKRGQTTDVESGDGSLNGLFFFFERQRPGKRRKPDKAPKASTGVWERKNQRNICRRPLGERCRAGERLFATNLKENLRKREYRNGHPVEKGKGPALVGVVGELRKS